MDFNHSKYFLSNQIQIFRTLAVICCMQQSTNMFQILVKIIRKKLFHLPSRHFTYDNLIGTAVKEIDVDSYHLNVCRSMNDHIMHRFTISHSYLTIANYFNEEKRYNGFTGTNLFWTRRHLVMYIHI